MGDMIYSKTFELGGKPFCTIVLSHYGKSRYRLVTTTENGNTKPATFNSLPSAIATYAAAAKTIREEIEEFEQKIRVAMTLRRE